MPAMQPHERPGGRVYGGGPAPGHAEPTSGGAVYGGGPISGRPGYPDLDYGPTSDGPSYGGSSSGGRGGGDAPVYGDRRSGGPPPPGRDPLIRSALAIGFIGILLGILFATGLFVGDDPLPAPPPATNTAPASPPPTTAGG